MTIRELIQEAKMDIEEVMDYELKLCIFHNNEFINRRIKEVDVGYADKIITLS